MTHRNRSLFVAIGALVALFVIGPMLMGGMMGAGVMRPGMMGWTYPGGIPSSANGWIWGLGMGLGGLLMLAFWGALIIAIVLVVRSLAGQFTDHSSADNAGDPLVILRRRYAAGEVDQATFTRMRSELVDEPQPAATR